MPEDMHGKENQSSVSAMMNLGAIPGHENPKVPPPFGMSESSKKIMADYEARLHEGAQKGYIAPAIEQSAMNVDMAAGGDDDAQKAAEERLRREYDLRKRKLVGGEGEGDYDDPYASREGYVGSLIKDIKSLAKEKSEPEREKIRERIAENRIRVYHASLDELDTLNGYLEALKNPYPYDSRWSIQLFDTILKSINVALREKGGRKLDDEGRAFLKTMKADMLWAVSSAKVNEAMGPAYSLYFDGELELSRLRETHTELLASDFERVYKKEISGLKITDAERQLVIKIISKTPDVYLQGDERYKSLKEKSLREVSVEFQDAYDSWSLDAIAASQKNLEFGFGNDEDGTPSDKEQGEYYKKIDGVTYRFMNILFDPNNPPGGTDIVYINKKGEKTKVRSQLLNPYCMPRTDEGAYKMYHSRMHELTVGNQGYTEALDKIRRGISDKSINEAEGERLIKSLADKVILESSKRIEKWESLDENNPFDRVADTVIKSMINLERGKLSSGELGWGYAYEEVLLSNVLEGMAPEDADKYKRDNEKRIQGAPGREFVVVRKSELGSIYDNHDVTTVVYWARHIIDYDKLAETRGSILPASIGAYRSRWESEPPYFRPELLEFAKDDLPLLRSLGLIGNEGILSDGNKLEDHKARVVFIQGKIGRQEQKFGKFDGGVREYGLKNVWAYMTPFMNDPNKGDYYLCVPMFLPTFIPDINFDRTLCLEKPGAKPRDYPKGSVWHQRLAGESLSNMKWENMDRYKYNWALVTNEQMERWLGPWVTPAAFNRATKDEFEKHTLVPSGTSEKESGKRFRLGGRAGLWAEGILRATVGTQSKIWAQVWASPVMKMTINNLSSTLAIDSKELIQELDTWRLKYIAPWLDTLLDMPPQVRGVKNYSGTSAQVATVNYLQARRIQASMIVNGYGQKDSVNVQLDKIEDLFK